MSDPIDVSVHVHFVMTGTFPLRVADVLFTGEAVLIPEYEYLTPLLGIGRGGAATAAERARERYRADGPAGLGELAERTHRIPYSELERSCLYDSRLTNPKLALEVREGVPYAYRIHAPVDLAALGDALRSLGSRKGFDVTRRSGLGFSPQNSLRRFLADR